MNMKYRKVEHLVKIMIACEAPTEFQWSMSSVFYKHKNAFSVAYIDGLSAF